MNYLYLNIGAESENPKKELLALSSLRPPINPFNAKYNDPIMTTLLRLPYVSYDHRRSFAESWDSMKPDEYVYRVLDWYARYDRDSLLAARLAVVVSPILLMHWNIGTEWIVAGVIASMFIVEYLDRVRVERERELAKEAAKREYWDEIERPWINARKRVLRRQISEEES